MNDDAFNKVQIQFGQLVKDKRKELGLSQVKLAELVFSNKRSIIDIELGRGNPTLETVYKLIEFLKIDSHLVFDPEPESCSAVYAELTHMLADRSELELRLIKSICQATLEFADDVTHTSAV